MPFDFKKEYREFYLPKAKPEIVAVPRANYIAVRGRGDPNEENGAYQRAIGVLYAVAYTLKMSKRAGHEIEGFFDYVVPPLEGFWQMPDTETVDYGAKIGFLLDICPASAGLHHESGLRLGGRGGGKEEKARLLESGISGRRRGALRADTAPRLIRR